MGSAVPAVLTMVSYCGLWSAHNQVYSPEATLLDHKEFLGPRLGGGRLLSALPWRWGVWSQYDDVICRCGANYNHDFNHHNNHYYHNHNYNNYNNYNNNHNNHYHDHNNQYHDHNNFCPHNHNNRAGH